MSQWKSRLLVVGIVGALLSALTAAWPGAAPRSILAILLPLLVTAGGWALLYHWRLASGLDDSAPLLHYALLVMAAYVMFGWLLAPSGRPGPDILVLSVGLLSPVVTEWVRDHGHFKKPAPESDDGTGEYSPED